MDQKIETDRLLLRKFEQSDAKEMFEHWASDEEATKYLTWPPHRSIETVEEHLRLMIAENQIDGLFHWAIVEKQSQKMIGRLDVIACDEQVKVKEIGYVLGKNWWHHGYMTEALTAVISFLFDSTDTNRVEANHDEENQFSGMVMAKAGMKFEGVHPQRSKNNQGIVNQVMYGVTKEQYLIKKNSSKTIYPVEQPNKEVMELLLLADPDPLQIVNYGEVSYFVLAVADELVGAIVLGNQQPDSVEIVNLVIKPSYENQGYGSFLLSFAEQFARQQAKQSIVIKTSTTSLKQLYLYQKLGFRCIEIVPSYFLRHYEQPIFENQLPVKDQIILKKLLIN